MVGKDFFTDLLDNTNTLRGKVFALLIQFLIIVSLVTFSIDTLPNLSENLKWILYLVEIITVVIFSFEYILRCLVAKKS
ncbi:hypothetical protein [Pseudoalteromonas sp. B62]|uniref:hypothetical protein n=1 Tax=Pseudoalteromonas sp. B62 TaxID=630483 RepID=UPI00301E0C0F